MNADHREENLYLRECLALERTTLANERTFLSYARTAVMLFITGVSVFKLFPEIMTVFIFGWIAIGISVIVFFIGLNKYVQRYRAIEDIESKCKTYNRK